MIKRFMISLSLLLMIGGSVEVFAKDYNKHYAQFAAGSNMDVDQLEPFLTHVSTSILDAGLSDQEIKQILTNVQKMNKNNETKRMSTFKVMYLGEPANMKIEVEVHVEDGNKEVVIYLFSTEELVDVLDKELLKIEEAME
ncbi:MULTISPECIES: hypothetical protein [Bacillus]|uniref:DUF3887 domain-containing protein n=2 Tax=Bacillus TaxID=1386 RepID=A0ABR6AZ64_9BACI|nr:MULTISPECIES: hypothetical protein [Bacillus]MDH8708777.1 hypothetical protein [Micromonospora sp. 1209]AKU30028.1 hypothetical protein ID12_00750 [Bacillus altitudinis]KKK11502.1 hypothetical protein UF15_00985 [Bacillus sp. L_1B0_12]MBA8917141.1 hypothetical protein [Bacillus aerius]MCL7872539.1 hypothetical protein [Bacillus altitudinis]